MKKITQILIALVAFSLVLAAFAQTTLSTVASSARDTAVQEDQSKLPSQSDRVGYFSYVYNVARDGGSGAVEIGPELPDNVAVVGGFVQVLTAFTPANSTNTTSIGIESAADILAAANLTAGIKIPISVTPLTAVTAQTRVLTNVVADVTNTYTVVTNLASTAGSAVTALSGTPVVTTAAGKRVTLTFAGNPATNGVAHIFLQLVQVQ